MTKEIGGGRIAWIDALRFVAFCAVVVLHVSWIESVTFGPYDLIGFCTRFAVPVFFMITGFMLGLKGRDATTVVRGAFARLFPIFLFWEAVYIGVDVATGGALRPLPEPHPIDLVRFVLVTLYNGGVAFHLWFLVWLGVSVLIYSDLRRLGPGPAWVGVLALFAVGLAIGPYGAFTGMLDHVGALTAHPTTYTARDGPFFGPLFVALGALVALRDLRTSRVVAVGAIVAGLGVEIVEGIVIASRGGRFVSSWDVTLGTPIFALGVFLLFRSFDGVRGAVAVRSASLGRLALGMYCVHALFTDLWNAYFPSTAREATPVAVTVLGAVGVIVASLVVTSILARVPPLRRFVR